MLATTKNHYHDAKFETPQTNCRRYPSGTPSCAWSVIKARKVRHNALESLIGRFNHAAVSMPIAWHFLGHLRALLHTKPGGYQWINVQGQVLDNLHLWIQLLTTSNHGLLLNLLVTQ